MDLLDAPIRNYDWGSTAAIAAIQGRPQSSEPEAELWIGAHPSAPARLVRDGRTTTLDQVIAADPAGELGVRTAARWDDRLPYLLKVLAAAHPLSLQTHPTRSQAEAGFADENARGVPLDAPDRLFRDANHKPELICALTPFTALCGFRRVSTTIELLDAVGGAALGSQLVDILRRSPDSDGVREAMVVALRTPADRAAEALVQLAARVEAGIDGFEAEARWLATLAGRHPADPAVFVAAMLNLVVLEPGQALFLAAGNLHSYLEGVGIEVMANSDNVLRGGLTSKHVDVEALATVVSTRPQSAPVQTATEPVHVYDSPVEEFRLVRIVLSAQPVTLPAGPLAGLLVEGSATVSVDGGDARLDRGDAVWFPARDGERAIAGRGLFFAAFEPVPHPVD